METTDILDSGRLLERYQGRRELVEELYRTYLEDLPGRMERFQTAADGSDLDALGNEAHALKGACGTLYAAKLGNLALELERAAKQGEARDALELWARVREGLKEVAGAMRAYL